jgi:hypothetical protein
MEQIEVTPFVEDKLKELVTILFNNEYFGFIDSSIEYVNNIVDFLYTIPTLKHKKCNIEKDGAFYCKIKENPKTTWFVTFDKVNEIYIIKNIYNNHSNEYAAFVAMH